MIKEGKDLHHFIDMKRRRADASWIVSECECICCKKGIIFADCMRLFWWLWDELKLDIFDEAEAADAALIGDEEENCTLLDIEEILYGKKFWFISDVGGDDVAEDSDANGECKCFDAWLNWWWFSKMFCFFCLCWGWADFGEDLPSFKTPSSYILNWVFVFTAFLLLEFDFAAEVLLGLDLFWLR